MLGTSVGLPANVMAPGMHKKNANKIPKAKALLVRKDAAGFVMGPLGKKFIENLLGQANREL
jgi:hypothetical protein